MPALGSQKETTARDIAAYLSGRWQLTVTPRLFMWRETVRDYYEARNWQRPEWPVSDCGIIHDDFKRYRNLLKSILHRDYGVTTIFVAHDIRKYLKHGESPSTRDAYRTDTWYRSCITSGNKPGYGFVTFPRDTNLDHPLLIASLNNRTKQAATSLGNAINSVCDAQVRGNITSEAKCVIVGQAVPAVSGAIEHSAPRAISDGRHEVVK